MDNKHVRQDASKKEEASRPAVSWVAQNQTLIELLYDAEAQRTAFAVSRHGRWRIENAVALESGERLVPFSPRNNLIRNRAVMLPSAPEEYGTEADLLSEVQSFIHRYVDLSPTYEKLASHYVLFSWLHDAFNELPYLRLRGDFGTGKTRGLLTIGSLCYKPFFASGASTVSPIFHILDAFRGTLVLDEADFRFSDEKAELVKILNNGNARGMPVLRTVVSHKREFDPRAFHVYGPKIVATRGSYMDRALESRFLTEETGTRRLRSDIPINLPSEHAAVALTLRNKLLLYRFRTRENVVLNPALSDRRIEPRLNQILTPLLSIIDDRTLRTELLELAGTYHRELLAERSASTEAQLLQILLEAAAAGGKDTVLLLDSIARRFRERHGADYARPITNKWVGHVLRAKLRLTTYKSHGTYVVPVPQAQQLAVLRDKYGIGDDASPPADAGTWGHGDVDKGDARSKASADPSPFPS